jgi:ankyrin repeat protein
MPDRKDLYGGPERMKEMFRSLKELEKDNLFGREESALSKAVFAQDLDEINRLLDAGADVNERDWYGSTLLLQAVGLAGAGDELKQLQAAMRGGPAAIAKQAPNWSDKNDREPPDPGAALRQLSTFMPKANDVRRTLREAAERRRHHADSESGEESKELTPDELSVICLLIDRGADLNAADREGKSALHQASASGIVTLIDLLLDKGASIDVQDKSGKTPLYLAAEECNPAAVARLLARGANSNHRTMHGATPLMSAASGGSKRVVQALLDYEGDPTAKAEDATTALLCAALQGYEDIVSILRETGAETGVLEAIVLGEQPHADLPYDESGTPRGRLWGRSMAMWAARYSRPDVIRKLHELGVSMNMEDRRGRTPIQVASMGGDSETIVALLECGAAPVGTKAKHSLSPLRWAATSGDPEKVRALLAAGADFNEITEDGETPLMSAVSRGNVEAAKLLLEAGADPNVGGMGMPVIAFATMRGDTEMVKLLVEHGAQAAADLKAGDRAARFPITRLPGVADNHEIMGILQSATGQDLFEAAKSGDNARVRELLDAGRDVNGRQEGGQTPLRAAVDEGHIDMVRLLLERGADPNLGDMFGSSPLHCAVLHGRSDLAQLLVERGANVNTESDLGMTPLLSAAVSRHDSRQEGINWLLEAEANVRLQEAAALEDFATLRNLLDLGRDVNAQNRGGLTALMMAARVGQSETLRLLLTRHAEVDLRDRSGQTALTWAAMSGHEDTAILLLDAGADPNGATDRHFDPEDGVDFEIRRTPLHAAVMSGKRALVKLLLDRGANIEARGHMGETALHTAAMLADETVGIIDDLLERGADLNATSWGGETPLMRAAMMGRPRALRLLIARGAKVDHRSTGGQTALSYARMGSKNEEVIRLLEEANAGR